MLRAQLHFILTRSINAFLQRGRQPIRCPLGFQASFLLTQLSSNITSLCGGLSLETLWSKQISPSYCLKRGLRVGIPVDSYCQAEDGQSRVDIVEQIIDGFRAATLVLALWAIARLPGNCFQFSILPQPQFFFSLHLVYYLGEILWCPFHLIKPGACGVN